MKILVPAFIAAAMLAAACDRAPVTKSEYNNSGTSATPAQPANTAMAGSSSDAAPANSTAPAAADASANPGGTANVVGDTVTTGKVKAAIAADSGMKDSDISVTTNGGLVTLSGTVKSQDQVTIASNLAQRQDGVQKVDTANVAVK
jgi:hyperosmotically inducible periplasmic protein